MPRSCVVLLWLMLLLPPVAGAQVLFEDNFNSGKSPRWHQVNDGPVPGNFAVSGGAYEIASPDPVRSIPRAVVLDVATTEYFIQADVRVTPTSSTLAAASLLANYGNPDNYYEFSLDAGHAYWSLNRIDKTGSSPLAGGPVSGTRPSNRLGLYAYQGDIRAFINGVMVTEQTDSHPLPVGAFGLSARGAQTRWDNVRVVVSNPGIFSFTVTSQSTNSSGHAMFQDAVLQVLDQNNHPISGAAVCRIRRDALSYFILEDAAHRYRISSGFASEFENTGGKNYRVVLSPAQAGARERSHQYTDVQTEWLLALLRRTAPIAAQGVTVSLQTTRNVYLLGEAFLQQDEPLDAGALGPAQQRAEVNGVIFGRWEEFGDYKDFPSVEGPVSASLLMSFASRVKVPDNSKFTLYLLKLSGAATVNISWFVQEDSRAFVYVETAQFPSQLTPGLDYTVPFTILNTGEAAGPFRVYVKLSVNSFMGTRDLTLGYLDVSGLGPGARTSMQIAIHIPANVAAGRYFVGTFLFSQFSQGRILRLFNSTAAIRPVTVGNFPANGQLDLTLTWSAAADLDLHVTDPYGETIYYFHPRSVAGAALEQDSQCAENGGQEHVQYPNGSAAAGLYVIEINYFRSCGAQQVQWNLQVTSDHGSSSYQGTIQPGQYVLAAGYTR